MNPNDVLIETTFKIFIIFLVWLAVLSLLDIALQVAILIGALS